MFTHGEHAVPFFNYEEVAINLSLFLCSFGRVSGEACGLASAPVFVAAHGPCNHTMTPKCTDHVQVMLAAEQVNMDLQAKEGTDSPKEALNLDCTQRLYSHLIAALTIFRGT